MGLDLMSVSGQEIKKGKLLKLLIISHVVHYQYQGQVWAYGPYAREIELWADLFPEVLIASPLRSEAPPGDNIPFTHSNISILPQLERGGEDWRAKLQQILSLPGMMYTLSRAMQQADAVHVRCPGNLGLLGVLLSPLFCRRRIAKYAGQWTGYPGEAWSYQLQRKLLKSRWWGAPVTVYGDWPNQPGHVVPFFTSVMSAEQMSHASHIAATRQMHSPVHILYTGRLTLAKNVHILIKALSRMKQAGAQFECRIVGQGPDGEYFRTLAAEESLLGDVVFVGSRPYEEMPMEYEWADVLVLASETEGWPKTIAEGMAFGLICIGSNRGLVPQMLAGRGVVVPPGNEEALASVLDQIIREPLRFMEMQKQAALWAQQFTLDELRAALKEVMEQKWGVSLLGPGKNRV